MAALDARSLLTHETTFPRMPRSTGAGDIVRMVGGLRSEWWARSDQNAGRLQIGIGGAVQRSLLWWHGPGEFEMPHTDANRPVIANWWFPRRGAI